LTQFLTPAGRFLLKLARYARYGPVGLNDPQEEVEVWLRGPGDPKDVTRNNVIAALRPFTIGVMLHRNETQPRDGQPFRLTMHDRRTPQRLLGVIHIHLVRTIDLGDHRFCLFEVDGSENLSVPAASLRLYYLQEQRRAKQRRRKNPYNFQMTPADLRASHVFYICPRPVVFVSVEHEGSANLFPMDLIGPTDSPWFSMALRSTSPAVRLMQQSRRMALAGTP
jgi:flavin reductase (DIM6/NTAB) family NADH-FMN oxidoreductase RutF